MTLDPVLILVLASMAAAALVGLVFWVLIAQSKRDASKQNSFPVRLVSMFFRLIAQAFNLVDAFLVHVVAWFFGMNFPGLVDRPWGRRLMRGFQNLLGFKDANAFAGWEIVRIVWMLVVLLALIFAPAVFFPENPQIGVAFTLVGITGVIAVQRRWSWIESDYSREVAGEPARLQIDDDLRTEALLSLAAMLALIPMTFYYVDQAWDLFDKSADIGSVAWFYFAWQELIRGLPILDWSEVFSFGGPSEISARGVEAWEHSNWLGFTENLKDPGRLTIFSVRVGTDLILLNSLFQWLRLSQRSSQQIRFQKSEDHENFSGQQDIAEHVRNYHAADTFSERARVMAKLGPWRLISRLNDSKSKRRKDAAEGLSRPDNMKQILSTRIHNQLICEEDDEVKATILRSLGSQGGGFSTHLANYYITSENDELVAAAAIVLAKHPGGDTFDILYDKAQSTKNQRALVGLVYALWNLHAEAAKDIFISVLKMRGCREELAIHAIFGLNRIGDEESIAAIVGALKHPAEGARERAVIALLHYPSNELAWNALFSAMKRGPRRFEVARNVVRQLPMMSLWRFSRSKVLLLRSVVFDVVRNRRTSDALVATGIKFLSESASKSARRKEDPDVLMDANLSIHLYHGFKRSNWLVRLWGVLARRPAKLGPVSKVAALSYFVQSKVDGRNKADRVRVYSRILNAAERDKSVEVRVGAISALGSYDDSAAVKVISKATKNRNLSIRIAAIGATKYRTVSGARILLKVYLAHDDARIRLKGINAAANILQERESEPALEADLIPFITDKVSYVRRAAIRALGNGREIDSYEKLETTLQDPDHNMRVTTVMALSHYEVANLSPTMSWVVNDPDWRVRRQVIAFMGGLSDPKAIDHIVKALLTEDPRVILEAVKSVVLLGKSKTLNVGNSNPVFEALAKLTKSTNLEIRYDLPEAIGYTAHPGAYAALLGMLEDKDRSVVEQAILTIGTLGNSDALDVLVAPSGREDTSRRAVRLLARAKLGDLDSLRTLLGLIIDEDSDAESWASSSLGWTEYKESIATALKEIRKTEADSALWDTADLLLKSYNEQS